MHPANTMVKPEACRAVARWLFVCAVLVALMVAVGGYTRLSGSGLSITAWKPVHGTLPPLSDAAWEEEFAAYRHSPQYQKVNAGMNVEEFKIIFWPEYVHRLLGRAIGVVFALPLLWFAARRKITPRFVLRLTGIFALGGLQGVIGWYMVKSGLVDDPHVSHFRLALHLAVAFALFVLLLWNALSVRVRLRPSISPAFRGLRWIIALLGLQIVLGALLAGLHGGLIYNSFPLMNGEIIPAEAWAGGMAENIALIQFAHRWAAVFLWVFYVFWWRKARTSAMQKPLRRLLALLPVAATAQVLLGIATLLMQAPLGLALAHQAMALLLFALTIIGLHGLYYAADADREKQNAV